MGSEPDVVYASEGLAVACFDAVVITLVRSVVTSEFLAESYRAGQSRARRYADGVGSLTLVPVGTPIPEGRVREEAARYTRESASWLRGGANVVWGQGFGASTIRSVLTAMTLFASGPPRRTFASPSDAVEWLAGRLGAPVERLAPIVAWSERALGDDYRSLLG